MSSQRIILAAGHQSRGMTLLSCSFFEWADSEGAPDMPTEIQTAVWPDGEGRTP